MVAYAKQWMAQWKSATHALKEVRRRELAALTDERALSASNNLLNLVQPDQIGERRRQTSGLVTMQALLTKMRQ